MKIISGLQEEVLPRFSPKVSYDYFLVSCIYYICVRFMHESVLGTFNSWTVLSVIQPSKSIIKQFDDICDIWCFLTFLFTHVWAYAHIQVHVFVSACQSVDQFEFGKCWNRSQAIWRCYTRRRQLPLAAFLLTCQIQRGFLICKHFRVCMFCLRLYFHLHSWHHIRTFAEGVFRHLTHLKVGGDCLWNCWAR